MSETQVTPTGLHDPAARAALTATFDPEPGSAKPDPILKVDTIVRQFGGMKAVDVGHLEVQRGLITALIGPNGAGKTTFFNLITGFDRPTSGRSAHWSFDGRKLDKTSASSVAKAGMVRTFQLTKALNRMTVMDNMMLGATGQRGESLLASMVRPLWSGQEREIEEKAKDLLQRFKRVEKKEDYAGSLSGGQRSLLKMVLRADDGTQQPDDARRADGGGHLDPTQSLLGHIQSLRDEGMTVLSVENDMHVRAADLRLGRGDGLRARSSPRAVPTP